MKVKQDQKIKETDDWKNKYLRALADYQNLERRIQQKILEDKKNAARDVIIKFIPLIDDLVKAQAEIKNEGLKLIIDKFDAVLKTENVQRKNCLNQKYDESIMECISIVEGKNDDEVVEEVRPAYFLNGEIIRTAQVIVAKIKKDL